MSTRLKRQDVPKRTPTLWKRDTRPTIISDRMPPAASLGWAPRAMAVAAPPRPSHAARRAAAASRAEARRPLDRELCQRGARAGRRGLCQEEGLTPWCVDDFVATKVCLAIQLRHLQVHLQPISSPPMVPQWSCACEAIARPPRTTARPSPAGEAKQKKPRSTAPEKKFAPALREEGLREAAQAPEGAGGGGEAVLGPGQAARGRPQEGQGRLRDLRRRRRRPRPARAARRGPLRRVHHAGVS